MLPRLTTIAVEPVIPIHQLVEIGELGPPKLVSLGRIALLVEY